MNIRLQSWYQHGSNTRPMQVPLHKNITGESRDPAAITIDLPWSAVRAVVKGPCCPSGVNIKDYVSSIVTGWTLPTTLGWVARTGPAPLAIKDAVANHALPIEDSKPTTHVKAIEDGRLAIEDGVPNSSAASSSSSAVLGSSVAQAASRARVNSGMCFPHSSLHLSVRARFKLIVIWAWSF